MATATIYATGTHKQKENYGCFGVGILSGKAKKTKDSIGQFDSNSKTETQLNILIYAVALAVEDETVEEIKVFSDFALVKSITDGTIDLWESLNWKKENGNPVTHTELWSELFDLLQKFDITFSLVDGADTKMDAILKKVKSETKKPKKTIALFEDDTEEVVEVAETVESVEVVKEKAVKKEKQEKKEKTTPVVEAKQEKKAEVSPKSKEKQTIAPPVVEAKQEKKAEVSPKSKEKQTIAPPVVEDSISPAEQRVKSATVSTEKIQENMFTSEDSTIKIDAELKEECEKLFSELGMPLDVAVTLFLKHSLRKKGFSFNLKLDD